MSQKSKKIEVFVEENSRFAGEDNRYKSAEFDDFDEALNHCKSIVDDFLKRNYEEKMTAEELYQIYKTFGEDAFIADGDSAGVFSAWEYARERCRQICEKEI